MILAAPHLILPPEKPALIRPGDGKALWTPQRIARQRQGCFPFPFVPPGAAGPASISFRTSAVDAVDRTTYTFAAQDIGTAGSNRHVIVAGVGTVSGSPSISSVSVAAQGATSVQALATVDRVTHVWIAQVTSGTTGDVVVTFNATVDHCGIAIWAAYDLQSATPVNTQVVTAIGANAFPALTTSADGVAVWAIGGKVNISTWTWTGGPSERYDATVESPVSHSGADSTTTGSSISATATPSDGGTLGTGVAASFR